VHFSVNTELKQFAVKLLLVIALIKAIRFERNPINMYACCRK